MNFYDSNEILNWNDVVQVRYDLINSTEISCPICMEYLSEMICPRITKCGHIYCWSCMLQYLDYEKDKGWKKCPLCSDTIYPLDLKCVNVHKTIQYKEGDMIEFDLIVRNKSNCLSKNKFIEHQLI